MDFFANFLNILLWSLWFTIWVMFIFLIIRFVMDVWRDEGTGVGGKIFWTLFLVFLPVIGALIYIIARGKGMAERDVEAAKAYRAAEVEYTKNLMYDAADIEKLKPTGSASELKVAKELLDSGTITQAEFDTLKAKALA